MEVGGKATPRPHYPQERNRIHIVQEAGWASRPVWAVTENLAPDSISVPSGP